MLVNRGLLSERVLIEPKWNLKTAKKDIDKLSDSINRTKVEFKVQSTILKMRYNMY